MGKVQQPYEQLRRIHIQPQDHIKIMSFIGFINRVTNSRYLVTNFLEFSAKLSDRRGSFFNMTKRVSMGLKAFSRIMRVSTL